MFDGWETASEYGTYMFKSSGGAENWFRLSSSSRLSEKKYGKLPTHNFLKFPLIGFPQSNAN